MTIELKVPELGESVQQVQIAKWKRQQGDHVQRDEELVELDTDKATMQLAAPATGVIAKILKSPGDTATIGEVIALIDDTAVAQAPSQGAAPAAQKPAAQKAAPSAPAEKKPENKPAQQPETKSAPAASAPSGSHASAAAAIEVPASPSIRRELRLRGLPSDDVVAMPASTPTGSTTATTSAGSAPSAAPTAGGSNDEVVKPMSMIRRRIAERLVAAQHNAALLTTFNEVDMSTVMELRKRVGEAFLKRHGVKLGFMSFFVRATVDALQLVPELNAEIRGTDIVYHQAYHVGVAIGSPRGLVVPIIRNAERLSSAGVESAIADFATRAGDGKLLPDELQGGTFTISNGGVYGSLLSTPIVNPPQSGVLGMHAIEDRPVARQGQVVIRPMMNLALTYDHRIVDGRGAVTFLKHIKELIEDPARMLLEV